MQSKSYTIAFWGFLASLVYIGAGLIDEIHWGTNIFKFRAPDANVIFALLTPSLGLYGFRRFTDSKYSSSSSGNGNGDVSVDSGDTQKPKKARR